MATPVRTMLAAQKTAWLTLNNTPVQLLKSDGAAGVNQLAAEIDNRDNTVATFFETYDQTSSPSLGSDLALQRFKVPAGIKRTIVFNNNFGVFTTNKRWLVCVTAPGGTTSPAVAVKGRFWTS